MSSAIEIKINSEVLEEIVVTSLKQAIPDIKESDKENLECMNSDGVMSLLKVGRKAFDTLLTSGILKPTKIGDGYKFPLWAILEFQKRYQGYDLTTLEKCVKAKKKVDTGNVDNKK